MARTPAGAVFQPARDSALRTTITIPSDVFASGPHGVERLGATLPAPRMSVRLSPDLAVVPRGAVIAGESSLPPTVACLELELALGNPLRLGELCKLCHSAGVGFDWPHHAIPPNEMRHYVRNVVKRALLDGDLVVARTGGLNFDPSGVPKTVPSALGTARGAAAQRIGSSAHAEKPKGIDLSGGTDYFVVRGDEVRSAEERVDPALAAELVERMFPDPLTRNAAMKLSNAARSARSAPDAAPVISIDPHKRLQDAFLAGELALVSVPITYRAKQQSQVASKQVAPTKTSTPTQKKYWIEFQVINDETTKPVQGVELKVKLPDGSTRTAVTNAQGMISFNDLPQESAAEARCEFGSSELPDTLYFVTVE